MPGHFLAVDPHAALLFQRLGARHSEVLTRQLGIDGTQTVCYNVGSGPVRRH
jgi:hypothetical protein